MRNPELWRVKHNTHDGYLHVYDLDDESPVRLLGEGEVFVLTGVTSSFRQLAVGSAIQILSPRLGIKWISPQQLHRIERVP